MRGLLTVCALTILAPTYSLYDRVDLIQKALRITDEELEYFLSLDHDHSRFNEKPHSFLVCVELLYARESLETLTNELLGANTIYSSKSEDSACFLAYDEKKVVMEVASRIGSSLVVPMPSASKISRSFFKRLVDHKSGSKHHLILSESFWKEEGDEGVRPSLDGTVEESYPIYPRRAVDALTVTFAVGADVPIGEMRTRDWLMNKIQPFSGVGSNKEFWFSDRVDKLSDLTNEADSCDYSKLEFSYHNIKSHPKLAGYGRSSMVHLSGFESLDYSDLKESCLLHVISQLASDPSIIHVAPRPVHTPKNYRVSQLVQSADNAASLSRTATPIWDFGLNGTGQIVGIADTGMDTESCFFSSSDSLSSNVFSSSNSPTFDLSEPKVVQYVKYEGFGDYLDEFKGHGSHVAGTAIGYMGDGWPSVPVADTCANNADNVSQCHFPDYYSGCEANLDFCNTAYSSGGDQEGACAYTCMCKIGFVTRSNEMSCSEYIAGSDGVAYGAKVAFYDMGDQAGGLYSPNDLENDLFPIPYLAGARLHSNSWGAANTYTYEADDLSADTYLYNNMDFLILFAAGNDGADGVTSVGSPAQSKNGLTVGASETGRWQTAPNGNYDPSIVADFSSQGPAEDGRIKPEVVAPGYYTMSAMGSGYDPSPTCKIHYELGTSMATPATAGAAALVREYLSGSSPDGAASNSSLYAQHTTRLGEEINTAAGECIPGYPCNSGIPQPTGMLVKAILIHSTAAMTGWDNDDDAVVTTGLSAPPDFSQGFGRISLDDVLLGTKDYPGQSNGIVGSGEKIGMYFENRGSISSNRSLTYRFHLTSNLEPLKATLVWFDPPNSVSASKQLLHDLDLTITDVSTGTHYYSNGETATTLDELNPTEKVWIESPATEGDYLINITASVLTEATTQPFALVISGAGFYVADGYTWEDIYTTPSPTITPAPSTSQQPSTNFPTELPIEEDDDDKILGLLPNEPMYLIGALFVLCGVGGFLYSICSCLFKCCCGSKKDDGSQAEKKESKKEKNAKKEDRSKKYEKMGGSEMVMIKIPKGSSVGDKIRAPGTQGRTVTVPRGAKAGSFVKLPLNKKASF